MNKSSFLIEKPPYDVIKIDLGVDRTYPNLEYYPIYLDRLTVKSITGTAYIRFGSHLNNPRLPLSAGDRSRFTRHINGFWIENSPQPGKFVILAIGYDAGFELTTAFGATKIITPTGAEVYPAEQPATTEATTSGNTTDSFTTALDWDTRYRGKKTIIIKNTGTANSLDYEVYTRAYYDGGVDYQETTGTLAPGDVAKVVLDDVYARVFVDVKSTNTGNPTSYRIDYIS